MGTNIIIPPIKAVIDKISVAEEAVSFAILAKLLKSGEARSTTAYIAVFTNSKAATSPITIITKSHSTKEIDK